MTPFTTMIDIANKTDIMRTPLESLATVMPDIAPILRELVMPYQCDICADCVNGDICQEIETEFAHYAWSIYIHLCVMRDMMPESIEDDAFNDEYGDIVYGHLN